MARLTKIAMIVGALLASQLAVADGIREGRTAQDRRFLAGGVGLEESERMKQLAGEFPLSMVVAGSSGEYLADTQVLIRDARGQVVLKMHLEAPYLLVDLPAGRYTVTATNEGKTQERGVSVESGKPVKTVFTFATPADVSRAPSQ